MRDQNHTLPHTVIKSSLSPKFQKQTKMYKIMFWARTCTGTSNLCLSWLKWAGSGKKECFWPAMASNNCAGTFTLEKLPVFLHYIFFVVNCSLIIWMWSADLLRRFQPSCSMLHICLYFLGLFTVFCSWSSVLSLGFFILPKLSTQVGVAELCA